MSEWVEWRGGECPIPHSVKHEVKFRNGTVVDDDDPDGWSWEHNGLEDDITAYRVVNVANDNEPASDRAAAINDLVAYFHGKSAGNGWWPQEMRSNPLVVSNKLALIHSEISEAMEGDRKGAMDDKLPHRKMIEVELGDALIRICDLAGFLGLDLGGATMEKDAYNDNRADHKAEARQAVGGKAY